MSDTIYSIRNLFSLKTRKFELRLLATPNISSANESCYSPMSAFLQVNHYQLFFFACRSTFVSLQTLHLYERKRLKSSIVTVYHCTIHIFFKGKIDVNLIVSLACIQS